MPAIATMSEVIAITGGSQRDIENFIGRQQLASPIAPAGRGRARSFTQENVVELAALAAFVAAGMPPSAATAHAARLLRDWKHSGRPSRRWLVFVAGKPEAGKSADRLSDELLEGLDMSGPAPVVCAIDQAAMFDRIEAHFREDG